jgi:hypothetical protein
MSTIRKDFKHGDFYVTTSGRDALCNGIATGLGTNRYDKDITFDEAIDICTRNMQKDYPGMDITEDTVKQVMPSYSRYFLNMDGEVISYENHEKPDIFDIRYINGEDCEKLMVEKDNWLKEHNVTFDMYDEDGNYRCWEN